MDPANGLKGAGGFVKCLVVYLLCCHQELGALQLRIRSPIGDEFMAFSVGTREYGG